MTRLRYKKDKGLLYSDKILAGVDLYRINILTMNKEVVIVNSEGIVVDSSKHSNIEQCKKYAKEYLKGLGAVFNDEIRPR